MKWEAHPVGAIEVAEQALAGQGQEGDHEAEHPDPQEDGDGAPPARRQVLERVDDADVLLQGEVGEQEHRHLGGQHGQGADDLALNAVHPGLSVPVVLAAELQVVRADHEEVDPHQPVRTCTEGGALPHDMFSYRCSTKVSPNPSYCTAVSNKNKLLKISHTASRIINLPTSCLSHSNNKQPGPSSPPIPNPPPITMKLCSATRKAAASLTSQNSSV